MCQIPIERPLAGPSGPVPFLPHPKPLPPMSTADLALFFTAARDDDGLKAKLSRLLALLSRFLGARGARACEIDDILGRVSLWLSSGGWRRIASPNPVPYLRRMALHALIAMRRLERRTIPLEGDRAAVEAPDESRATALSLMRDRYLLAEAHFRSPALRARLRAIWELTILHALYDRDTPGNDEYNACIDARLGRAPAASGKERQARSQDVSNLRHRLRVRLEIIRLMEEHPGAAMRALFERPERLGRGQRPEWFRMRLVLLRFLRDEVLRWRPAGGGPSPLDGLLAVLGGGRVPRGERDALRRLGLLLLARWPKEAQDVFASRQAP